MARHQQRVGYGLPLLLAIGLHVGILVISVIRFPAAEREPPNRAIVQATLVSTETTTDRAQRAEQARAAAEAAQQAEATRQAEQEAARQQAQEQARQATRQAAEEAAEEARRRTEEAERQGELRERQRQAEEQRRREAEAERQRQAEAARQAAEAAEQARQRAIEAEAAAANARQAQQAANGFINLVRQAVEQAWAIPPNVSDGATAEVSVRLGPSGELFAATIGRSSGDNAFDRSAIQAVEAAAPFRELLELPGAVQREYRQFNLRFRPGEIR